MTTDRHDGRGLIVIFGASGDLTQRKLVPALYDLFASGRLGAQTAVLGVSRTSMSDDAFRERLRRFHDGYQEQTWGRFATRLHYHAADSTRPEAYDGLKRRMARLAAEHGCGADVLFYLSMSPRLYEPTITRLGEQGMVTEGKRWCSLDRDDPPWQRIIIEKPFGSDPASASQLNRAVGRVFEEESIYRIDHYLGKETVQNLLVVRFANTIFEPIWNRQYIDHVQVTAAESVGVEGRGGYYDSPAGGAVRDMIQSHLLQVMALVAMEPPITRRAADVRVEKTKVLAACRTPDLRADPGLAVHGQYGPGHVDGRGVPGFRQEPDTAPESRTDTYAAMKLFVDTWRWGGVPFYLRSGKRMRRKLTEVVVTFKPTPHCLFRADVAGCAVSPNQLVINVQPDEGIRLQFAGKVPGGGMTIRPVVMDFDYVESFRSEPPEAYGTLLLDALRGDQTLFKHREEIEHCWRIVQPVLDHWGDQVHDGLPNYAAGTWGPSAADMLMARDGRAWHNPGEGEGTKGDEEDRARAPRHERAARSAEH